MNVILIFNGLGNQMSQYATYIAQKNTYSHTRYIFYKNGEWSHNGYELDKSFGLISKDSFINKLLLYLYIKKINNSLVGKVISPFIKIYKENLYYDVDPKLFRKRNLRINYYWGGWHSEKNFENVTYKIKNIFTFNTKEASIDCLLWAHKISADHSSISVHVRRGDYLNAKPSDFYKFNEVATVKYYRAAIDYISNLISNATFYFFSDDLEWCKTTFGDKYYYINCNTNENSRFDMYLISLCKHHINANSTFSWWGAWLKETKDTIIIVPEYFIRGISTKDVYPERWIKISSDGYLLEKQK